MEGNNQAEKRDRFQIITGKIADKKAELQVYVQRAWGDSEKAWEGEVLGLADRRDFYHGRLLLQALESERVEFKRVSAADEYVHYVGKAVSARE